MKLKNKVSKYQLGGTVNTDYLNNSLLGGSTDKFNFSKYNNGVFSRSPDPTSIATKGTNILSLSNIANVANLLGGTQSTSNQKGAVGLANAGLSTLGIGTDPISSIGGAATNMLGSLLNKDTNYNDSVGQWFNTGAKALSALGPVGSIVGSSLQMASMLGSSIIEGTNTDDEAKKEIGSSYNFGNYEIGDTRTSGVGNLLGSGKSQQNKVNEAQLKLNKMSNIADTQRLDRSASTGPNLVYKYMSQINGGLGNIYSGKQGLKLNKEFAKNVIKLSKQEDRDFDKVKISDFIPSFDFDEEIPIFGDGGKVNVIPDGALHAHKNHLEDVNEDLEGVTEKGIPVISEEDGEIKQHAEVEREEIIFRLEVTTKLEELRKDNSNKAAIEAGELLVKEILHNTVDNTGIINKVE